MNNPHESGLTFADETAALSQWGDRLAAIASESGDAVAAQAVQNTIAAYKQSRFVLAILGKAKRGKSTLMNAMLGRSDDTLAPIDKLPASSAITRFRWAEKEEAIVTYQDGRRETIPYSRIREFVTEEFNPENQKGVAVLNVSGPFPGLDPLVELVDTPGAGSMHEHHDAILHGFIPEADAVIFLVTAKMPLDNDELALLAKVKAADVDKIFFAINKVDAVDERDLQDAIDHNRKLLSEHAIPVSEIHRISAKNAFKGKTEDSGLPEFLSQVGEYLDKNKGAAIRSRLVGRVLSIMEPIGMAMDIALAGASKSGTELDGEIAQLKQNRDSLQRECNSVEEKFTSRWELALNELASAMTTARQTAIRKTNEQIAEHSLRGLDALGKDLPSIVSKNIETAVEPASLRFEHLAREACEDFRHAYPAISTGTGGLVNVRVKGDNKTLIAGVAGGATLAAGGAGLMLAGASTAAAIASANAAIFAIPATVGTLAGGTAGLLGLGGAGMMVAEATATGFTMGALGTSAVSTPMWVALASPVGWALAGVGLCAIPLAWMLSKKKKREKLNESAEKAIEEAFRELSDKRIPQLRSTGKDIAKQARAQVEKQLGDIEKSLSAARTSPLSEADREKLADRSNRMRGLAEEAATLMRTMAGSKA